MDLRQITLHVIFFLSGITTVLIGQVLPTLARRFTLSDLEVSYFFPAQFSGSIIGTFFTSRFARRNNYFAATLVGTVLMAAGILMMNAGSFTVCLAGFTVNGIGIGLTLPAINMMILEMNLGRAGAALSVLNFCWGFGAIVCKPFVDAFGTQDSLGLTTWLLAVPLVFASGVLLILGRSEQERKFETANDAPDPTPIWTTPLAWMIALFNLIHVGFESGMGGWLTTYTERVAGPPIASWISPTLLYFTFFVLGRGFAPVLFRFFNESKMLMLGLVIVLVGMIVILAAPNVLLLSLGAAISGFGTSWIFPTNVARFSQTFGPTATRRATPLFIFGTLGAASSTWLIGFVSDRTGSLNSGMYVLLISVGLLVLLQIFLGTQRTNQT
jgi:fucose permease